MKIVHITQATSGGVYTYISDLMTSLRERGCSQALFCPEEGPLMDKTTDNGFEVESIHAVREISPLSDLRVGFEIASAIKRHKPDLVHLHSSKAGAIGRLIFEGTPVIYTPHGWAFNMAVSQLKQSVYAMTEKFLSASTVRIIAISKYEYKSAIDRNICEPEKMVLIENGINLEAFEPVSSLNRRQIRRHYAVKDDEILIGAVGRLTDSKNPALFIDIAKTLKADARLRFMWVGDGELSDDMMTLAEEQGVADRIIFTGWTERVGAHMQAMDIGLHTASWEGFGLAIAEFMAAGVPVVSSSVGGTTEIIDDGITGFLCDNADLNSYIDPIRLLIADPILKENITQNALKAVREKYAHQRLVDQHIKLYTSILEAGRESHETASIG